MAEGAIDKDERVLEPSRERLEHTQYGQQGKGLRYANRKNVIGMSELILILPSINSKEFPSDFETAERTYGSLLDRDFSRITLIDNNSGFSTGDPPNGISELLRERG